MDGRTDNRNRLKETNGFKIGFRGGSLNSFQFICHVINMINHISGLFDHQAHETGIHYAKMSKLKNEFSMELYE